MASSTEIAEAQLAWLAATVEDVADAMSRDTSAAEGYSLQADWGTAMAYSLPLLVQSARAGTLTPAQAVRLEEVLGAIRGMLQSLRDHDLHVPEALLSAAA